MAFLVYGFEESGKLKVLQWILTIHNMGSNSFKEHRLRLIMSFCAGENYKHERI